MRSRGPASPSAEEESRHALGSLGPSSRRAAAGRRRRQLPDHHVPTTASPAGSSPSAAQPGCAWLRPELRWFAGAYLNLLVVGGPSPITPAPGFRATENGAAVELGQGLGETADAVRFSRTLVDDRRCGAHTEAVVDEDGAEALVGVRLLIEGDGLAEVETYVTREGDCPFFDPAGFAAEDRLGAPGGAGQLTPPPAPLRTRPATRRRPGPALVRSAPVRRVVAVLAAGALAIAACGGDGAGDEGGGEGASVALRGTLRRATLFDTQRAFSLTLEPTGDRDLVVETIQLRTPLFETVPAQRRDSRVRARERAVVMPLRYGEARCAVEEADVEDADDTDAEDADVEDADVEDADEADADHTDARPAELVARVDGEEVRLELAEVPDDLLAGLHAAECRVADVLDQVDVRFGERWEPAGPRAVATDLELVQRRAGVEAAVMEFEGNVIFTVDPGEPGLEVGGDRRSDRARVVIEASRCDPHALIEYKRKFILTARVRVGDAEPVRLDVEAEGVGRRTLEQLLATCLG
ncbi:MAG TPA: hypothetical protein VIL48_00390 [Acidimicrobiales bacterium]